MAEVELELDQNGLLIRRIKVPSAFLRNGRPASIMEKGHNLHESVGPLSSRRDAGHMTERRRTPRTSFGSMVVLTPFGIEDAFTATSLNIGKHGMLLQADRSIAEGLLLKFSAPTFAGECRVVWSQALDLGGSLFGITFSSLGNRAEEELGRLLRQSGEDRGVGTGGAVRRNKRNRHGARMEPRTLDVNGEMVTFRIRVVGQAVAVPPDFDPRGLPPEEWILTGHRGSYSARLAGVPKGTLIEEVSDEWLCDLWRQRKTDKAGS